MSFKEGQCIYFNGVQHDKCEKGIEYKSFRDRPDGTISKPCLQQIIRSVRGGTLLKPGEEPASVSPFPGAAPKTNCPHYTDATPEQIQQQRMEMDAAFDRMLAGVKVVAGWRIKPKPAVERKGVLECPICKGKLHVTQSSYNGHVHAKCETPKCVSWME